MSDSAQPFGDEHAIKCELAGETLRSSGTLRLQVTGWSMLPAVWPGDVLVIDRAESKDVAKGDIVLFGRDRRLFAHRVLSAGPEDSGILTRGDSMPAPDPIVREDELLGKVSFIVRNGKYIAPGQPGRSQRAIAALVRSSNVAARLVVGMHGMRQIPQSQT